MFTDLFAAVVGVIDYKSYYHGLAAYEAYAPH